MKKLIQAKNANGLYSIEDQRLNAYTWVRARGVTRIAGIETCTQYSPMEGAVTLSAQNLFAESDDFRDRAISPLEELGAYEALWDRDGATFKRLADRFAEHPDCVPSDFVPETERREYAEMALNAIGNAKIAQFGVRIHGAGEYPAKLREADHPIKLLYYQGAWDLVDSPSVAVVGTRSPTEQGQRRAQQLTRQLVEDDFTVVSGLAAGIDTVAHKTAIERGGRTIAVLGTPITSVFPKENEWLQRVIARDFLVISQVPILRYSRQTWHANRSFFPARNVTMSALTSATIIVEAGETSGTLIQARHAIKQKRKLFILDSCFTNRAITWPAKFEKQGAIRVRDYSDIRERLVDITSAIKD